MVSNPDHPPLRSSPACERNQTAIGSVLREWVDDAGVLLEVGSGTGQHAAYLIDSFSSLIWQPSDRVPDVTSIMGWAQTSGDRNRIRAPVTLDAADARDWSRAVPFDSLLTINTLHIMSWSHVCELFRQAARFSKPQSRFLVYGPFHENGEPTSEGNAVFDQQLRAEGSGMGIRDIGEVRAVAAANDWLEQVHYHMPANNRMLVFLRASPEVS
ncbi:MAG: DUF938 domain-containing protein [Pseudomonadota bacterium]